MRGYHNWRVIAGGIVGMALLAIVLLPATGWVVRHQVQALFVGPTSEGRRSETVVDTLARQERVAATHPDDFPLQMALAFRQDVVAQARENSEDLFISASFPGSLPEKLPALHRLEVLYANQPSLHAAILRTLSVSAVTLDHRIEQTELISPANVLHDGMLKLAPRAADLAEWERTAQVGERLDPGNAFFPLMRSVGLFASKHDEEALKEIHHAATLPRYEDYGRDEVTGVCALLEAGQGGEVSALQRWNAANSVVLPQFVRLHALARLAVVQAVHREQYGDSEGGFAIRRALLRCGARLRTDSSWMSGSLWGTQIVSTAESRPGGIPAVPWSEYNKDTTRYQRYVEAYESYLRRIQHPEEIAWVRHEEEARKTIQVLQEKGLEQAPNSMGKVLSLSVLWGAGAVLLGNLLLVVGIGALTAGLSRTYPVREGKRLPPVVAGGAALSILPLTLIYLLWDRADCGATASLLGLAVLAVCIATPLLLRRARSIVFHLVAAIAVMTILGSLLLWISGSTIGCFGSLGMALMYLMGGYEGGYESNGPLMRPFAVIVMTSVPLLVWILLVLVSLIRRVPVSVGTVRGFARAALPLATVISLAYVMLVGVAGGREAAARTAAWAAVEHEGRAYAAFRGRPWPLFAP